MPGAMTRSLLAQLLLVNCVFAITQNCVFKTGVAEGYVACATQMHLKELVVSMERHALSLDFVMEAWG
jgi:hypothetical protein